MVHLQSHGVVAVVEILAYIPLLLVAITLVMRHGFARDLGWIYLAVFSIIRVAGGVSLIILENSSNPSSGLTTTATILASLGVTPLMMATLGFIGIVGQNSDSLQYSTASKGRIGKILHLAITVVIFLSVEAGSTSSNDDESKINEALRYRKIAGAMIAVIYAALCGLIALCWSKKSEILYHRQRLLFGMTCAMPFLGVRVLYTFIGAFESINKDTFSPIDGNVFLYIVMAVIMEFIIISIYLFFGISLPLDSDTATGPHEATRYTNMQPGYQLNAVSEDSLPQKQYYAPPAPQYYPQRPAGTPYYYQNSAA